MAPITQKVASARALLEHAIKAEAAERDRIAPLEAEKEKLKTDQDKYLLGWSAQEPEAVAAMESLDSQISAIDRKIDLHKRTLAQLAQRTQQERSKKLAIEREHEINRCLSGYDALGETAEKITETITKLKALYDEFLELTEKAAHKWPSAGKDPGATVPIAGIFHHREEAAKAVGIELWRLTIEPFATAASWRPKQQFPGPIVGSELLTGKPLSSNVARQDQLPSLPERMAQTKEYVRQVLLGERSLGGSHAQIFADEETKL